MRTDLRNTEGHKVRSGKMMAQVAHASVGLTVKYLVDSRVQAWLEGPFVKTVLAIGSEEGLLNIVQTAREAGLLTTVVTDAGRTEFGGVPTITCAAIGPDLLDNIDAVTGHLKTL